MKISVVQSVAEALFRYHSGKYATLPLVEELRRSIKEYPSIGAVSIKASAGRDLMFSVYTRNTFHGMVDHTRRPAVPQPDKKTLLEQTILALISAVVLNFRASPDQMTVKAHGRAKPRWDIATNDDLARVVLLGLSAPVSVITLSDEEFSVFVGGEVVSGWSFRPPEYFNQVLRFPNITR
ncbi:hypothetical protein ACLPJK_26425 [Pseudomonas aeruginosa]|uniref:hypothetical protein n=1 Tax=Pseudomonas aeruginosa TaxID=287 RepID=UPI003D293F6D